MEIVEGRREKRRKSMMEIAKGNREKGRQIKGTRIKRKKNNQMTRITQRKMGEKITKKNVKNNIYTVFTVYAVFLGQA